MSTEDARRRWEMENNIQTISTATPAVVSVANPAVATSDAPDDGIYKYDNAAVTAQINAKPWARDPHYFKQVKMSAIALLKMVMHARAGGTIEVMGLMLGKVQGNTMIVMDSFALPVEGTETRVNAGFAANEYMVDYINVIHQVGRMENAIGWYHSHPGYGCWLSGIDVSTQLTYQQYQEPWLAVVVDPTRTISAGKVEIGAFRTYPSDYKAPDEGPSQYQSIPLAKIEDFGVHCKAYYPVPIQYFKSSLDSHLLDLLWHKYWVSTLSSSSILTNATYISGQLADLADKLEQAEIQINQGRHHPMLHGPTAASMPGADTKTKKEDSQLGKLTKDCAKTAIEHVNGIMSQIMKDMLFNPTTAISTTTTASTTTASSAAIQRL